MKLSYRGISYEAHPVTAPTKPAVPASDLKYRGASYRRGEVAKAESQNAILTYRGMSYSHQSSDSLATSVAPQAVDLKYRGTNYRLCEAAKAESQNAILTYRGMSYSHQPVVEAVADTPVAPAISVQDKARVLTMNHYRVLRNRQQTVFNRSWNAVAFS
ncbi:DUF4278 domain-containing protein [Pantanalinema sp. GBBB05]|uniref:DUF4278 domain-containing protein n=1 Tax=Pantanalinema sp. GBBB05 TaxID=2604139 RepID=UPI001D5072BA|nr:DUF4278 domain-containing protein [Pantanalinema sp. GBBB05]